MAKIALAIDHYEPAAAIDLMRPVFEVSVDDWNTKGFADYMWNDLEANTRQWERKQLAEALTDLGAVEEQLGRELESCTELTLAIEGIGVPHTKGVQTYQWTMKCNRHGLKFAHWCEAHNFENNPQLWSRYQNFKFGLLGAGVQIVETTSLASTMAALTAAINFSWRSEHTTLRRYVIPHVPPMNRDPHIDNLMRLRGNDVGEVNAKKLIHKFGTVYDVMTAEVEDLIAVVGRAKTYKLLNSLGRWE